MEEEHHTNFAEEEDCQAWDAAQGAHSPVERYRTEAAERTAVDHTAAGAVAVVVVLPWVEVAGAEDCHRQELVEDIVEVAAAHRAVVAAAAAAWGHLARRAAAVVGTDSILAFQSADAAEVGADSLASLPSGVAHRVLPDSYWDCIVHRGCFDDHRHHNDLAIFHDDTSHWGHFLNDDIGDHCLDFYHSVHFVYRRIDFLPSCAAEIPYGRRQACRQTWLKKVRVSLVQYDQTEKGKSFSYRFSPTRDILPFSAHVPIQDSHKVASKVADLRSVH